METFMVISLLAILDRCPEADVLEEQSEEITLVAFYSLLSNQVIRVLLVSE